jgi:hypothetical protein
MSLRTSLLLTKEWDVQLPIDAPLHRIRALRRLFPPVPVSKPDFVPLLHFDLCRRRILPFLASEKASGTAVDGDPAHDAGEGRGEGTEGAERGAEEKEEKEKEGQREDRTRERMRDAQRGLRVGLEHR